MYIEDYEYYLKLVQEEEIQTNNFSNSETPSNYWGTNDPKRGFKLQKRKAFRKEEDDKLKKQRKTFVGDQSSDKVTDERLSENMEKGLWDQFLKLT